MIILQVESPNAFQVWLAAFILLFLVLWLTIGTYRFRFLNLSDEQKRHKKAFDGQLEDTPSNRLVIPTEEWGDHWHKIITAMFGPDWESPNDRTTVSEAKDELRDSINDSLGPWIRLPRFSRWLTQEAILIIIGGGLTYVSAQAIRYYLTVPSTYPDFGLLVESTKDVLDTGVSVITTYPFLGTIWNLVFAYGVLLLDLMYSHWWIIGPFILLGAGIIAILHRYVPDELDTRVAKRNRKTALLFTAAIGSIWLMGVVPATIGANVGAPDLGALVGFILSFILTLGWAGWGAWKYWKRLKYLASVGRKADSIAYLISRRIWGITAILSAPITIAYYVVLVTGGKAGVILGSILNASWGKQILLAMLILGFAGWLWYITRDALPTVRQALGDVMGDRTSRLMVFAWGAPTGIFVGSVLILSGFRVPWPIVIATSVVMTVLARFTYEAFLRIRYRTAQRESAETVPKALKINARTLEDADGETVYHAIVNGHRLAHKDKSLLLDSIITYCDSLASGDEPPAVIEEFIERDMLRLGIVDPEESITKVEKKIRTETFGRLNNNNGRMEISTLRNYLDEYPKWLVDQRLKNWEYSGSGTYTLNRHGDYYSTPSINKSNSFIGNLF